MKISKATLDVLKNFAGINSNLVVRPGNTLATVAITECLLAEAKVEETFPEFAIYDLAEFLGVLSLFKGPELEFGDSSVTITEGSNRVQYTYGDPLTFKVRPPEQMYNLPSEDIKLSLTETQIKDLLRAAAILKAEDIMFVNEGLGSKTYVQVRDIKNPSCNNFCIEVESQHTGVFNMVLKTENIRMMPGGYDVVISKKKIAKFINQNIGLTYFVALHASSTYDEGAPWD